MTVLALVVIVGFVLYVMTPEERTRLGHAVQAAIRQAMEGAVRGARQRDPFRDALGARTPWMFVTPALVVLNLAIFLLMLLGTGAFADPETLVAWGGNYGPRTTNGEWWRLLSAMFVHPGMLHLLVNLAALAQLGLILERLVGHLAFAVVYIAAGLSASLVSVSVQPVAVSISASGAVSGIYGLLFAALMWGMLRPSAVTIPLTTVKTLAPPALVFILYNLAAGGLPTTAYVVALAVGFVCGLAVTRDVREQKPPARRVAAAAAVTIVIAWAVVSPPRGIADVRPELEFVVALEDRTARAYESAAERFRAGRTTAAALAQLIDRTILPELEAAGERLNTLGGVPEEDLPLVADAEEYVRLRHESWRIRTAALNEASMLALRKADRTEQASLEVLKRIRQRLR